MAFTFRRQGVYGGNLPTKKSLTIQPSDFSIGCIVGIFERKYDKAILLYNPTELIDRFGIDFSSSYYGYEAAQGFFQNSAGTTGKLYVKSHVGCTDADTIDAVIGTDNLADGTPEDVIKLEAAYQGDLDYGAQGNRTGYKVTNGTRTTTAIKTASLNTDTFIYADSVADIFPGDLLKIVATGGGGATVYHLVGSTEESTGKVNLVDLAGTAAAFDGAANPEIDDVVSVLGFKINIYRKDINGIVSEVDKELGLKWLSTQSNNTRYYAENVYNAVSKWIKTSRLTTTPATLDLLFPVDVASITYLASGADGTAPTTSTHWARDLNKLDNLPVRFIANPETTNETIQKAIEIYCKSRTDDEPKVLYNIVKNQTKAQLTTIGQNFQRSDEVLGIINGTWLKIADPFNNSINAPAREIPAVGHIMGAWIRSIANKGIHYVPATKDISLRGIIGIVDSNLSVNFSDIDRTDLLNAGINIIQFVQGSGYVIRNFNTPTTELDYAFANGGLMKSFIKVSAIDSLQPIENEPNSADRIASGKDALYKFMYKLYREGSTGNSPEGETFGRLEGQNADDTFEVIGDEINNPATTINAGERNYDIYFQRPTPAGSIRIQVGLILP